MFCVLHSAIVAVALLQVAAMQALSGLLSEIIPSQPRVDRILISE